MNRYIKNMLLILLAATLLTGCRLFPGHGNAETSAPETTEAVQTQTSAEDTSAIETLPVPETPDQPWTEPVESTDQIPEEQWTVEKGQTEEAEFEYYSVEEVIEFFKETVLDAEYYTGDAEDNHRIRKWNELITYYLKGTYSDEDAQIIAGFYDELAEMSGFPGAVRVKDKDEAMLTFYFLGQEAFDDQLGQYVDHEYVDGCVNFWFWLENHEIYEEIIGINNDMDPGVRTSVIREEIYNGLGIVNDTELREDSLIYQYGSDVEEMSDMDRCLVKLLYLDDIRSGMTAAECIPVIRTHYEEIKELCRRP